MCLLYFIYVIYVIYVYVLSRWRTLPVCEPYVTYMTCTAVNWRIWRMAYTGLTYVSRMWHIWRALPYTDVYGVWRILDWQRYTDVYGVWRILDWQSLRQSSTWPILIRIHTWRKGTYMTYTTYMTYMWYTGWTGRTCDETQRVLSLECVLSLNIHACRKEAKAQRARTHVCGGA